MLEKFSYGVVGLVSYVYVGMFEELSDELGFLSNICENGKLSFCFDCEVSCESCDTCSVVFMDEVNFSSVEGWYLLACRMWHIVLYSWVLCISIRGYVRSLLAR
jgi:hypothetical protein